MNHDTNKSIGIGQLRTMQIIAGALIGGVVVFAVITLLLGAWNAPEREGLLKYVGLVFLLAVLVPFLLIPSLIRPRPLQAPVQERAGTEETASLLAVYQVRMIVRLALLEGAAFLNLIAFLIEHARWSLMIAAGLVVAMVIMFPSRTRVEHWIEAERIRAMLEN